MIEPLTLYLTGVLAGILSGYHIATRRHSSELTDVLVRETAAQTVLMHATSDIVDEDTGEEIAKRANEIAEEYDIPKDVVYEYGDSPEKL